MLGLSIHRSGKKWLCCLGARRHASIPYRRTPPMSAKCGVWGRGPSPHNRRPRRKRAALGEGSEFQSPIRDLIPRCETPRFSARLGRN
jgi:hypothetical protein